MNNLKRYLKKNKIRQSDMAEAIGIKQGTVSRLTSGSATPSLALAVAIERFTGGEVLASSWVKGVGVPHIDSPSSASSMEA